MQVWDLARDRCLIKNLSHTDMFIFCTYFCIFKHFLIKTSVLVGVMGKTHWHRASVPVNWYSHLPGQMKMSCDAILFNPLNGQRWKSSVTACVAKSVGREACSCTAGGNVV